MSSKLKGAAGSIFSAPQGSRRLAGSDDVHKCLVLPRVLHNVASEISFREEVKLKDMVALALESEVERLEQFSASGKTGGDRTGLAFSFATDGICIHTSVLLQKELVSSLRRVAHYSNIHEKKIVASGLAGYLLKEYREKHPDLLASIESYKSSNEAE